MGGIEVESFLHYNEADALISLVGYKSQSASLNLYLQNYLKSFHNPQASGLATKFGVEKEK